MLGAELESGVVAITVPKRRQSPLSASHHLVSSMGKKVKVAASSVIPSALFLGPRAAASASQSFLGENAITHVLSIGINPVGRVDGVTYCHVPLRDDPSASISKACDAACAFIDTALRAKNGTGRILIHCQAGMSRSPTIVAAYLMKRRHMSLMQALKQIVDVRPQVCPNYGFIQQLKDLEMELFGVAVPSLELDELPKREKDRLALFAKVEMPASSNNIAD